jgi:hypothetical protein
VGLTLVWCAVLATAYRGSLGIGTKASQIYIRCNFSGR